MEENRFRAAIEDVRNYLRRKEYTIPSEILESKFIESYLIQCDQNVDSCKIMLENYFNYKLIYPEYFVAENPCDVEFQDFFSNIFSLYTPKLTEDGRCIFVDKVTRNEKYYDMRLIMKCFSMETEIKLMQGKFDCGDIVLFDCDKLPIRKLIPFFPFFVKSLMLLQEFHVYSGGHENFLKHVSADVLPAEYDGAQPSLTHIRDEWLEKMREYEKFFLQQREISIWTTLDRFETFYGYGGSFKCLTID